MRSRSRPVLSAAVLLSAVLFAAQPVDAGGWIPLGPYKGQPVGSVAVAPGEPSRVFVTGVSGVFRSTSAALSWDRVSGVNGLSAGATGTLHSSQVTEGPVYLVAGSTLYRGDDPGSVELPRWSALRDDVSAVGVAPGDPSRLYATIAGGDLAGTHLEVSHDGGETWEPAGEVPTLSDQVSSDIGAVHVSPSDPDTLYLRLSLVADHGFPSSALLLRSTNAGATWQTQRDFRHSEPDLHGVYDLVVDPRDPAVLYFATDLGVYRSGDGGATLELLSAQLPWYPSSHRVSPFTDLVIDPIDPATLWAAFEAEEAHGVQGGVYRSDDGGFTWVPALDGLPIPITVSAIGLDPADPDTLFATTPLGVYRSTDRGAHWSATAGRLPTPVATVAVDPERPAKIFAGADHQRLFVSDDGGETWRRGAEEIPASKVDYWLASIGFVTVAPSDPSIVLAVGVLASDGKPALARSRDRGETWELIPTGRAPGSEILIDPRDPHHVVGGVTGGNGAWVSDDLGTTWQPTFDRRSTAIARAPSDPDVFYLGAFSYGPGRHGLCRSDDAGASWACWDSVYSEGGQIEALAVDPRDASVVLAVLRETDLHDPVTLVRRSVDGGITWSAGIRPFPTDPGVHDLVADPSDPSVVWLASNQGAWRSPDRGDTWERMSDGLTHPSVTELTFDPSGRVLLAATPDGVFRYSTTGGPAPPPEIPWATDPALSGFRVKVRIGREGDAPIAGTKEPACLPETVCFSGALPGRSEVFVRIVGPKPNGHLWPTLVKFTTSPVEVWIQQLSTGELRYYELRGAAPGFDELPGLFDRDGFVPD